MKYINPVISGFYPDPSVCRVEDEYYLVTSSFEYFPGVPVFHSKDLLNWTQIGHCLTRESQLPLRKARSSGGIYAPTIRYNDGTFYMVTTNTTGGGNFYVHTEDPAGEWSEPIWVDQGGIDPSLLFDDGKVYFTSNGPQGIYQSEIDINTGKRLSDIRHIWAGTGGRYPEAPHLYKIHGKYYLMIAEGGTEYGHMETIARSNSPWGPFKAYDQNPILTHRNRGGHPVQGTGHADMVEDKEGNWWMVFLAFRPEQGLYHHLGRETFLAPVDWSEDGWPVVGNSGTIELEMDTKVLQGVQRWSDEFRDEFSETQLKLYWNFLREPNYDGWSLTIKPGWLTLNGNQLTLDAADAPSFIGRRQQHMKCKVSTLVNFEPQRELEEAGLTVFMNEAHHYEVGVIHREGKKKVFLRKRIGDLSALTAEQDIKEGCITLCVEASNNRYTFSFRVEGENNEHCLGTGETKYLSSEVAGGFTGVYFGLYATGNGNAALTPAYFDWFNYKVL